MSFNPGEMVLVESSGSIGVISSVYDDEVLIRDSLERANKDELIRVSRHLQYDRWKQFVGNTDADEILNAWSVATVVNPPHGLDADEVRFVRDENIVLLRKDQELVTAIDASTCKTELEDAINRVA